MLRRILALSALVHCGFCGSHDLEEQSVKTSAGWLESTMSLTKLLPEHASERVKELRKHLANQRVSRLARLGLIIRIKFARMEA
ncbi:hypothetical protein GJ744_005931 [Endocarpon pusillum]|uniref:Uncharacterized protein n=1 Tax=Endocarpon pusillum TaxID=364733 RepID=A0A8H7APR9_9EURO|nr:hypothetical protein GJ744_005931 [Endocarpon pusillum]